MPAPNEGISHIIRLYLKKLKELKKLKRYRRVALAGSRIFTRVWQEVDGWECRGQMWQANALVPARAGGEKG